MTPYDRMNSSRDADGRFWIAFGGACAFELAAFWSLSLESGLLSLGLIFTKFGIVLLSVPVGASVAKMLHPSERARRAGYRREHVRRLRSFRLEPLDEENHHVVQAAVASWTCLSVFDIAGTFTGLFSSISVFPPPFVLILAAIVFMASYWAVGVRSRVIHIL